MPAVQHFFNILGRISANTFAAWLPPRTIMPKPFLILLLFSEKFIISFLTILPISIILFLYLIGTPSISLKETIIFFAKVINIYLLFQ